MINNKLTFSIVICTYNGAEKIGRTLDSIFAQNYATRKYEVIVVDDGSTDRTEEIVRKYNVTLVRHDTNSGIAKSRNSGLQASSGKYLVCIDDDCTIEPQFLNTIEEKYQQNGVIGVAANLIHPVNKSIVDLYFSSMWYGVAMPKPSTEKTTLLSRLFSYYSDAPWGNSRSGYIDGAELLDIPGACSSYVTSFVNSINGWDENLHNSAEDNDLCLRMIEKYPNKKIILALEAKVCHFQDLSFTRTLSREFSRRKAKMNFYRKHHLFPAIFPNPMFFIAALPFYILSPFIIFLIPLILYPWWIKRAIVEKDARYMALPYMQLIQEVNSNLCLIYALKD